MQRLKSLFIKKPKSILSVFFTAGYPNLEDTVSIIKELERSGVDLIEIGIPFSDPIADGTTIQNSSNVALSNGMRLSTLFDQLFNIREHCQIPLIMMGYLNPVIQYGFDRFCEDCGRVGIDGVILPDLPIHDYLKHYKPLLAENGMENIFLITPQTSEERIKTIDGNTNSFIYAVSSHSITGAKSGFDHYQIEYFKRLQNMNLKNPFLIGFGISDNYSFETACQYANGAIIGSAFIKQIANSSDLKSDIKKFIFSILNSDNLINEQK